MNVEICRRLDANFWIKKFQDMVNCDWEIVILVFRKWGQEVGN